MPNNVRIAILTLYYKNYNYGGQLQAYALQKTISNLGYECKQICFRRKRKEVLLRKLRALLRSSTIEKRKFLRRLLHFKMGEKKFDYKTINSFEKWMNSIPHTEIVDSHSIKTLNKQFDIFVVGSDQVWNTEFVPYAFFLDFVDKEKKKIAYAASIRMQHYEKKEGRKIKKYLNDFDYISVRERKAIDILREIGINKPIDINIDPTMLLTREQWDEIAIKPRIKGKYIFTYMISDHFQKEQINCFAKEHDCKVVSVSNSKETESIEDETYGNGPGEFVGLIKYADYVFVESFHGTAFSIIYGKKFLVYGELEKDDRKKTILEATGLLSRCINRKTSYKDFVLTDEGIDKAQDIVSNLRDESLKRLSDCLQR